MSNDEVNWTPEDKWTREEENLGDLLALNWDSPASTDTLTLRDVCFSYSILLEVSGAHVAQR